MQGYKLLTHDFRPPIQGGSPIFDGTCPFTTPLVDCDISTTECAPGWNFVRDLETGFQITGIWRTGRPNAVFIVEASDAEAIERGNKCRAAQITFVRHATESEIKDGLLRFSRVFGPHAEAMAEEQWLWWQALKRPNHDAEKVTAHLREALQSRRLDWQLKQFPDEAAAWDARAARDAWAAWAARDARAAWAAWDARAAWAARDARDAWAARAALTVSFTARSGLISLKHDHLTVGIRDAYSKGLAIALPTGPNELGWAMDPHKKESDNGN